MSGSGSEQEVQAHLFVLKPTSRTCPNDAVLSGVFSTHSIEQGQTDERRAQHNRRKIEPSGHRRALGTLRSLDSR